MTNTLPEFKYTAQGKKVRIMGKLNSTEYIVQEVFVDDKGNEIPAGENFVTKNLFKIVIITHSKIDFFQIPK